MNELQQKVNRVQTLIELCDRRYASQGMSGIVHCADYLNSDELQELLTCLRALPTKKTSPSLHQ